MSSNSIYLQAWFASERRDEVSKDHLGLAATRRWSSSQFARIIWNLFSIKIYPRFVSSRLATLSRCFVTLFIHKFYAKLCESLILIATKCFAKKSSADYFLLIASSLHSNSENSLTFRKLAGDMQKKLIPNTEKNKRRRSGRAATN